MRDALVGLQDGRVPSLKQHMEEIKKVKDQQVRRFLMKAIIPVLTEGMIEVWRVGPQDPVDYLADYIFKKSNNLRKRETANRGGN